MRILLTYTVSVVELVRTFSSGLAKEGMVIIEFLGGHEIT